MHSKGFNGYLVLTSDYSSQPKKKLHLIDHVFNVKSRYQQKVSPFANPHFPKFIKNLKFPLFYLFSDISPLLNRGVDVRLWMVSQQRHLIRQMCNQINQFCNPLFPTGLVKTEKLVQTKGDECWWELLTIRIFTMLL